MYPEVETQRESWFPVPQKGRLNDLSQNDEALSNHRRTRANADKMCRNAAASNWRPCLRARSRARCIKTCNSKAVQARGGPEGPCALCIAAPRDARVAPHVRSSARLVKLEMHMAQSRKARQRSCKAMVRQWLGVFGGCPRRSAWTPRFTTTSDGWSSEIETPR